MSTNDMRVERRKLWEQMKAMLDTAEKEKRKFAAEEEAKYAKLEADIDAMKLKIDEAEKDEQRRSKIGEMAEEFEKRLDEPIKPDGKPNKDAVPIETRAFRHLLLDGIMALGPDERRALQMDIDTSGGYTILPQQFVNDLIKAVDNKVFFRGLARTFTVTGSESLGAPALDANPADPTWTSEILIGSEDSTMAFGKRELRPHPLAQYIKVSKKLLRATALGVEALVRDRLAYKASVVMENAYLNGDGSNEPVGVFFAAGTGIGITTGQDVSTGNTDTEIRTDGLIEAKWKLKSDYWPRCRWIFHQDGVKKIRKLKDGDGQYIWKAGIARDQGDTILDAPVLMSQYAPNTWTTGLYVGIYGDFSNYWIADALGMEIQVLTELYAATNQNGYILRAESDGMPVLEEAFARVTLA